MLNIRPGTTLDVPASTSGFQPDIAQATIGNSPFQSHCRERVPVRPPMRFLKQIETLFRTGTAGGLTDGQLLERFLERRDEHAEAAFAALVNRHGAMVLRVCRQILRDEQDAEDAAQATFLVLARRAGTIGRRESVSCWLHGVALRVAAKARTAATRRRTHEQRGGEMRTAAPCR